MESFFSFLTTKKFPSLKTVRSLLGGPVTPFVAIVYGIFFALCATVFALLITLNNKILVTVPARGGSLTEGVIGAPHFINPILATTPTDQGLVALIYGSLMKTDENGNVSNSLVKDYAVSPDGRTYTITLLPSLMFDDGKPLTSDDVAFTVTKLQDNTISTASGYWQTIAVETPDANTVVFTLPAADTSFLSHLTFGILPKHIWGTVTDESFPTAVQNLQPVGAGVMKVSTVQYQNDIPAAVVLVRNKYFPLGKTLLDGLTIKSFANQIALLDAVNNGDVNFSYDLTPSTVAAQPLASGLTASMVMTPQMIAIYRSSADTALSSLTTVATINRFIDKNAIIATVQNGYGIPAGIPSDSLAPSTGAPKGFSLAVENNPDMLRAAQTLATQLAEHGVTIAVHAFDPGTFQKNITAGNFPLFLARSNDEIIPQQYTPVITLYDECIPYVFDTRTHLIPPSTFQSPAIEYEDVQHWYTNTDKLWKWFIKQQ
ncbi:MAG: family 5 extracellular solute-binding protein peptide/nickel transport system substrate-binding [Candidatus Nomurabacteria bacterium]|nr:family 5 extracellular solute-binding protein peptide/nickel transport system substrate-binding [Candidatus Nomurabacteria bacterium]